MPSDLPRGAQRRRLGGVSVQAGNSSPDSFVTELGVQTGSVITLRRLALGLWRAATGLSPGGPLVLPVCVLRGSPVFTV